MHVRPARSQRAGAIALAASALLAACGGNDAPQSEVSVARRDELAAMSTAYVDRDAVLLQGDAAAMALADELFVMHCAACHGRDGRGSRGITDLTRGRYNYGATAEAVRTTIRDGRMSEMPGVGNQYGEVDLGQIVAYVETLGTEVELSDYEARGRMFYLETCAACHGEDGRGQPAIGAADLTDDYWQHGDSMMNIRLAVTRGTESESPAFGAALTPTEIELLTARVLSLIAN